MALETVTTLSGTSICNYALLGASVGLRHYGQLIYKLHALDNKPYVM